MSWSISEHSFIVIDRHDDFEIGFHFLECEEKSCCRCICCDNDGFSLDNSVDTRTIKHRRYIIILLRALILLENGYEYTYLGLGT